MGVGGSVVGSGVGISGAVDDVGVGVGVGVCQLEPGTGLARVGVGEGQGGVLLRDRRALRFTNHCYPKTDMARKDQRQKEAGRTNDIVGFIVKQLVAAFFFFHIHTLS